MSAVDWTSPTWGHNPVHESDTGSWLDAEGATE